MSGPRNALSTWSSLTLHYVELPTGMKALVKYPNVPALLAAGAFPNDLQKLAAQFATGEGIVLAELTPEERFHYLMLRYDLTARALKYIAAPDSDACPDGWLGDDKGCPETHSTGSPTGHGWEAISLSGPELREHDVDQRDLEALVLLCGRQDTPANVTLASRVGRGIKDALEAQRREGDELSTQDFAGFRGQPGGADARDDGDKVPVPPVGGAADRRPGNRASRRRSRSD